VAYTNITEVSEEKRLQFSCSSRENLSTLFAHKAGPHGKKFVKSMDKTGRGFEYVRNKSPNVSDSKNKRVYLWYPRSGIL
jgi:hypothetical protein